MQTTVITALVVLGLMTGCKTSPGTIPGGGKPKSTAPLAKPSDINQNQSAGGTSSSTAVGAITGILMMTALSAENQIMSETKTQIIKGGVVSGTADTTVTWSVNGVAGGNPAFGFIDSSGLYTAPQVAQGKLVVVLTCVSNADPSVSQTISLTIVKLPKINSFTVE